MKYWILGAALICSSALAGETPHPTATAKAVASFESLDKNADRQISRTEAGFDRALSNGFAFLDANGDGFLSPEEYAARTKS
jgi:EF hand